MPKIVLIFIAITGLAACNTVAGAGQDIENTGNAIEEAAE
jgi:predicted small secreted protein